MATNKIADFINELDFKKIIIKPDDEYEGNETTPGKQLRKLELQVNDDFKLKQLKEVYAAFVNKVCVKDFPGRNTPAYETAKTMGEVLDRMIQFGYNRLMRELRDEDVVRKEIGALRLNTWISLLQAGPNGTHVKLMEFMMVGNEVEEYIQGMPTAEFGDMLLSMKIDFKYTREEDYEEHTYGSHLHSRMDDFFSKLSVEIVQTVRAEYMELYNHYYNQLPTLSPELAEKVGYIVRDMRSNLPDENSSVPDPEDNKSNNKTSTVDHGKQPEKETERTHQLQVDKNTTQNEKSKDPKAQQSGTETAIIKTAASMNANAKNSQPTKSKSCVIL